MGEHLPALSNPNSSRQDPDAVHHHFDTQIAPLPASDAAALLPHLCYKFRSGEAGELGPPRALPTRLGISLRM